jgi:adenine phosphoribosyltransferase
MDELSDLLDRGVREVPDWPSPGVLFRDITPLLAEPGALDVLVRSFVEAVAPWGPVDQVAGIEARGFVLGAPLAMALGAGFVPIRKAGKLPGDVHAETYDLEYGTATLELGVDAVADGHRVLVIDDVLATGGTAAATTGLLRSAGAEVVGLGVLLELAELGGRHRLDAIPVAALRTL